VIGFYSLTNIYFSLKIALKKKNIKYLFIMPILFASLHTGYGFGSIWGLLKMLTLKSSGEGDENETKRAKN